MTERVITAALRRSAERRGLSFDTFGHGWVARLGDGVRSRSVIGYDFDLNPAAAAKIAGDKAGTAAVLEASGVPVVKHLLFLRPDVVPPGVVGMGRDAMNEAAADRGWDVVAKSNAGTGGANVFRVGSPEEMGVAVEAIFSVHHAAALSPFVHVDAEYRVIVLDDEPQLTYEKRPAAGEWRHNLGLGGTAVDVDGLPGKGNDIARAAMRALGLRFASVDLVAAEMHLRVLEVNAGVMMEHYGKSSEERRRTADTIYDRAVAAMFA